MKSSDVVFKTFLVAFAGILIVLLTGVERDFCVCKIDNTTLSADCSGLGLHNLTRVLSCIPSNIRSLNLAMNSFTVIPDESFKDFTSLSSLNINNNLIEYLNDSAFVGLENLQELSLVTNRLEHEDSFSNNTFTPLKRLLRLSIHGNCDSSRKLCFYPEMALSHLATLQYLELDGLPSVNLGPGFSKLKNLQSLVFTDEIGHCNIQFVSPANFAALGSTPITSLTMEGCNIETLIPNSFSKLWNLTTLIITDNRHLCNDGVDNATLGLNETRIESIIFSYWCRNPPHHLTLSDGMLTGLTNTSLKSFVLEYNDIDYVSPECVENLPTSKVYLSLKENNVNDAHFLDRLWRLDKLQTFDLSFQNHYNLNQEKNNTINGLLKLSLNTSSQKLNAKNKVKNNSSDVQLSQLIHSQFRKYYDQVMFNLSNEELQHTIGNPLKNMTATEIKLPRHIKTIYMNNIKLKYPIPPVKFGANELSYLDASNCLLLAFLGPWLGLHSLEVFDLSSNLLTFIDPLSFSDMPNLRKLNLGSNQLGESILKDVKGITFFKQTKLQILNLNFNGIKDLPNLIFQNQSNLQELYLSDNSLQHFDVLLSPMPKLKRVDLSSNQIVDISQENRQFLDTLAANSTIELNLSNNTFICQCDNVEFMTWLSTTQVNIVRKDDLKCLFTNNTVVSLSRLDDIVTQLNFDCNSWKILAVSIGLFVGLLFILSVTAIVYHKRWQLRHMYHRLRRNLTPYHPIEDAEIDLNIDAYISYEPHFKLTDEINLHQFIADTLHQKLTDDGFTVKIREELSPSRVLFQEIPESVRKARKLLTFLTPDYFNEYWNTYEFQMAVNEGIYTNRNVICPVIIGQLSDIHMTNDNNTFLQSKIQNNDYVCIPSAESLITNTDKIIDAIKVKLKCY